MAKIKSLKENVINEFNQIENINEKITALSYNSHIYLLYVANIKAVTQKQLDSEFASYKILYPNRTYNTFIKMKKNFDELDHNIYYSVMGYFIDEETAIDYAQNNIGDINECGAYPFTIVKSIPLNVVYANCNESNMSLLKFDDLTNSYKKISWDLDEITIKLKKYFEFL